MSEILLLNPRRRRRSNRRRRGMPAGLRRYWASRGRSSNPRRRRRRARASNPRRRRRSYFRANPRRRRRSYFRANPRRRRRNPRRSSARSAAPRNVGGFAQQYAIPAVIGGVGGVVLDIAWGYLEPKLPANMQTGWVGIVAELALLWAATYAGVKAMPRHTRTIHTAALGAATILLFKSVQGVAQQVLPATTPGLSGYMPAARFSLGRLGAYQGRSFRGLRGLKDYYSPAAVVQSPVPRQFGAYQAHTGGGGGTMGYELPNDGM